MLSRFPRGQRFTERLGDLDAETSPRRVISECPSGCLRPARDVVPARASPELPENADRVAAVLRHAGSALPPTRPARRIWPSVARRTDGFRRPRRPRRGHAKAWPLPAARTTRVRLVREPGLNDGGDRAPSDQDRHSLEIPSGDLGGQTGHRRDPTGHRRDPTGALRGPTGTLRGLWFLRPTRRVRTTGRIESSPALPGASRVRSRRS